MLWDRSFIHSFIHQILLRTDSLALGLWDVWWARQAQSPFSPALRKQIVATSPI